MKTGKKIAVLAALFLIVAAVYFILPREEKEETGKSVIYTAMKEATLPIVYPKMGERTMAPLLGHREEKAVTAGRDSLIVLPEDRKLDVLIKETKQIASIGYEIRSIDLEHLIERTEVSDWTADEGVIQMTLPIQNLLEVQTEYQLGIRLSLKDHSDIWYYTRIIETDRTHTDEMLALAEEFSAKTFHYESAQDLTMYMESSTTADNSSFGIVTLKNSFSQMTWGSLNVERISEPRTTLKELTGDLANIELEYEVERETDSEEKEYYTVVENFTMKWTNQRIYMMDYERRMNEIFRGDTSLFSGKRILLGISDGEDVYTKKSADGHFVAFVNNRELWAYDSKEGTRVLAFSFNGTGSETDIRTLEDHHGIEILQVSDEGNIDFLVYGYMNRGVHEGWTGISYYHYIADNNTLEEAFFIPAAETYEELKEDVERLSYKGTDGNLYLYLMDAIYQIDMDTHEFYVVVSGLDSERFAVSGDSSRLAWQDGSEIYNSKRISILDLNTGMKTEIGNENGKSYQILGFVGNDCVYGIGNSGDYIMSNGRIMGLYLKSLEIVDVNMENAMHYEKSGYYIREVQVDESRIHITCVRDKRSGFFGETAQDTLVCNVETLPGRMDDIGWYASDIKGRIYFVQLAKEIPSGQKLKVIAPKKMVQKEENVLNLEWAKKEETIQFYAYGRGRLLGTYTEFADAVQAAYDKMGFVSVGANDPIWIRANKSGAYFIKDVSNSVKKAEGYRDSLTGESLKTEDYLILDASGTSLNQILYFVGQNFPVLVNTGVGSYQYLTGYDQGHVRLWDPVSEQSETIALETANERFESSGNDFVCCIYQK